MVEASLDAGIPALLTGAAIYVDNRPFAVERMHALAHVQPDFQVPSLGLRVYGPGLL